MELATIEKKNGVATLRDSKQTFKSLEDFTRLINEAPPKEGLQKTPDGKADTLTISHVEATLDEVYLGQWGTTDVNIQVVANEILVWLTLWVIHPLTKIKIERSGFAAVQITVDKAPDEIKNNYQEKNRWALNLDNKKPNACYLAFPKAKSEAIKNAAKTLGKIFGRELNRKVEDTPEDFYSDLIDATEAIDAIALDMAKCKTIDELLVFWNQHPDLQQNKHVKRNFYNVQPQAVI